MTRYFLEFPVPKKYLVIVTRYFIETGVAKFTIWDFSHADFGFFTCYFCGFGFWKTDYVRASWLRSSIFFLAFVLFYEFDFAKIGVRKRAAGTCTFAWAFLTIPVSQKHFFAKSLSLFDFFVSWVFPKLIPKTQFICSQQSAYFKV